MLRTIIIILALCGGLAWFLTGQAPQRSGTLTLQPAPNFPEAAKVELGRTVARFLPHCPGFSTMGGDLSFTNLVTEGKSTRITFSVPQDSRAAKAWGPYNAPCTYTISGDELSIADPACQALCLGKKPDQVLDVLLVNLNPAPTTGK